MRVQTVGVTGHQDLPTEAVELLRAELDSWFPDATNTEVICSLAAGADTLVAEFLIARGASLHVVVPSQDYLDTFDEEGRQKFRSLVDGADLVETLGFENPSEDAFMAAGSLVARSCDWLIAVWDGQKAKGLGGTGDVVDLARSLGKPVRVVWPEGVSR